MPYFFLKSVTATPPKPDIMLAPATASQPSMPFIKQVMTMAVTQTMAMMVLFGIRALLSMSLNSIQGGQIMPLFTRKKTSSQKPVELQPTDQV